MSSNKNLTSTSTTDTEMIDMHSHTYLCGHAEGLPEEYIKSAIDKKIRIFGVSDHAPLPENMRDGITMGENESESYIEMILSLKEKYASQIDIRLGFEVDYPEYESFNSSYYSDSRIDYLIGSCHFIGDWPIDMHDRLHEYDIRGIDNVCNDYFKNMLAMVESGKYNIIGHFDLFKKFGHRPSEDFSDRIVEIAKAAKRNDVALELNTSGLRKPVAEIYPSIQIVEIFAEEGAPFTLGSDSHSPREVGMDFDKAVLILKDLGVKRLSSFKMRKREELTL